MLERFILLSLFVYHGYAITSLYTLGEPINWVPLIFSFAAFITKSAILRGFGAR